MSEAPNTTHIDNEFKGLKDTLTSSVRTGIAASRHYANTHSNASIVSDWLGRAGAFLGAVGSAQNKHYQKVNLTNLSDGMRTNAFYQQGKNITTQLFGKKGASIQGLASKFIPEDKAVQITDKFYYTLAKWAQLWANHALAKDSRYHHISALSDAEKVAFANDIANQNRALVALGGLAAFAGLKGVVIDTAWLLILSLRTIYQLAYIYDIDINSTDGVQLAYDVLAGANLDKLQEKQVLLTALALGNTLLVNAQNTGLKEEITRFSRDMGWSNDYQAQIDEFGRLVRLDKFNLDKLNPNWLHRLLPITAMFAGAYYNNALIDEVIGTALASFSKTHVALLD